MAKTQSSSKAVKEPQIWLMKSEPNVYSILDLKKHKTTLWEGVRNYQARNFMLQLMQVGDTVLFYHSNAEPPFETGIAGLAEVCSEAVPDPLQFDPKSEYFDPKSTQEDPRWFCVNVRFKAEFEKPLTLAEIKARKMFSDMLVVKPGQRLSIQPVEKKHFDEILKLVKIVDPVKTKQFGNTRSRD